MKKRINWQPKCASDQELKSVSDLRQLLSSGSIRRSQDADYYYWKLRKNPQKKGEALIVYANEKVVGMASFTPKKLKIGSKIINAAEIGDTFTHPDYQRKGIFSTLFNSVRDFALNNCGIDFIYGTPNQKSLPGYEKKLNFPPIPSADVTHFVCPIKIDRVVNSRFGETIKAKILSIGMRILYALWFKPGKISNSHLVDIVETISSEMGLLWEQVAGELDAILVRDIKYLDWRFMTNPEEYTIWNVHENKELIGYVLTKPGLWNGLKVLYIADYLMLPGRRNSFRTVVSAILKYATDKEYDMLSCWNVKNNEFTKVLKRLGFLQFQDIPIICYANELGDQVINSNYKWHFTMADSDNI
ncbi:MAG: GNAT family N-acetyltransferase [Candidatus Cloacimonetes bacterium]|nr:GNAT family N-acetyltransferase [Candidatus Cloacimonadota bacterium]